MAMASVKYTLLMFSLRSMICLGSAELIRPRAHFFFFLPCGDCPFVRYLGVRGPGFGDRG
eukprot:scaffold181019_cov36-Tisochrysis_lutea.AAC.2